ncbi:hypothetical protein [Streptomyces katrae]|uniref:hypothetical protein n=1 Tax=Streptomyces katrae TaxID=68223 RepID=UPI0004C24402|nr:hypothetical protein [Streptomyces katrae]
MPFRFLAAATAALGLCLSGGSAAYAQDPPPADGPTVGGQFGGQQAFPQGGGFGGQGSFQGGGSGGGFPAAQSTNPSVDSLPPIPKFNQSCKGPDCKPRRFTLDFSRIVNRRILPPDNDYYDNAIDDSFLSGGGQDGSGGQQGFPQGGGFGGQQGFPQGGGFQ